MSRFSLKNNKLYKTFQKLSFKNFIFLLIGFGVLVIGIFIVWVSTLELPDFRMFTERKIQSSTKIYDRTGEILLFDIHQNFKRTVIPYEAMGSNIKNATVAIEDSGFYNHKGIRIKSIVRAVWSTVTGQKVEGGSTITQQLIKNTLLTTKKSVSRKVKEWILAVKLERVMSKQDILALYLNEAPYGGNIYGIEEASKSFFGKSSSELTLAEAAYLAAIPNGPTLYSPYGKHRDKLEDRKNLVLKRMLDLKFIDQNQYNQAKAEKVNFLPESPMNIGAPHFVFFIKDYIEKHYGEDAIDNGGLKVITTLDYNLQKKAEEIAKEKAKQNEKDWNGKNAAVVVIDPKTGQILAMVGSRDYFDKSVDGNFNVATAARQPGSSFKPIVYSLAFEKGYTEKTTLFDVRTEFNTSCSPTSKPLHSGADCYSPDNYDGGFRGPMTLKDALAQSINVVAVKLLYLVGVNDSIKLAHDLGITTLNDPSRYGLSLVIGGGETTLLDMTSVYSVFANSGVRNPDTGILSIQDIDGKELEKFENKSYQVLNPEVTDTLSSILSDDAARTPTFGANSVLNIPGHEVAVKTGTTNNNKDAWTIGYTPSVAVGVWVGNNDNTPMKKGGAALAGPIWNAVITEALKDKPVEYFTQPEPINPSLPPILRGFWQGGETTTNNQITYDTQTGMPINNGNEVSITNVHTILYWINKNNPLNPIPAKSTSDPQYTNWEYGVQKWWANNYMNYRSVVGMPSLNQVSANTGSKPTITLNGLLPSYNNDETVTFSITSLTPTTIKKVDIFINNTFLKSIKGLPGVVSFNPKDITDIGNDNTIRVIGYDNNGNSGEATANILIN